MSIFFEEKLQFFNFSFEKKILPQFPSTSSLVIVFVCIFKMLIQVLWSYSHLVRDCFWDACQLTLYQKFEEKKNLTNNWKFYEWLLIVYWIPHKGLKDVPILLNFLLLRNPRNIASIHPSIWATISKLPCEIYNVYAWMTKLSSTMHLHYLMKTAKFLWHPNQCFF